MWHLPAIPLSLPSLTWLMAQASGGSDLPGWFGPALLSGAGAFLATLMSGKVVVPTFAYSRERERADKWEAEAMRLNQVIADKVIPALATSTAAQVESTEAVKAAIAAFGRRRG